MSSGQRPRRPEHFPWMHYRGRARRRHGKHVRVIWWDYNWRPQWTQPEPITSITVEYRGRTRRLDMTTGYWIDDSETA